MDNPGGLGALLAVGVDVAHHVVAHQALSFLSHIVVNVILVGFQLVDLRLGHRQSQSVLRLGQGNPQLPPGAELKIVRKNVLHFPAGIPGRQGGDIGVMIVFHGQRTSSVWSCVYSVRRLSAGLGDQLCLLTIRLSAAPVSRSMKLVNRETLFSGFKPCQIRPVKVSKSPAISTGRGSPWKEGRGLPSP